jgi:membrane protein implicated in regulation of membrane protease activity
VEILYWHWWVLGFGLLLLEMFLPTGFVLIWIGTGALVVGVLAWLIPGLGWQSEMMLFGVLSIASFFAWRKFRPTAPPSDEPTLNRRGHSYVGRTFTLGSPIVNGVGMLHVDDSQWRISGADTPAGSQVRVVDVDGSTLRVERIP